MARRGAKREAKEDREQQRLNHRTRLSLIDKGYRLLRQAIGSATIVACFYLMYRMVGELAGKQTGVTALVNAVLDMRVSEYAAWTIAAVSGAGWFTERRLRRRTIKGQGKQIKELETRLAPERKSSGLLDDGQQKEADKDA